MPPKKSPDTVEGYVYRFTGDHGPETFPTLSGQLANAELEPGEEITVAEPVHHPRLEPVNDAAIQAAIDHEDAELEADDEDAPTTSPWPSTPGPAADDSPGITADDAPPAQEED